MTKSPHTAHVCTLGLLLLLSCAILPAQVTDDLAFVNRTGSNRDGLRVKFTAPLSLAATQPTFFDSGALPIGGSPTLLPTTAITATDTILLSGGTVASGVASPTTRVPNPSGPLGHYMRFTGDSPNVPIDVAHAVWMNGATAMNTVVRMRLTATIGVPANELSITLLDSLGAPLSISDIYITNDLGWQPYGCGYSLVGALPSTAPVIGFNCDISGYESDLGTIQLTCTDAREVSQMCVRWSFNGVKKGSSVVARVENASDGEDDPVNDGHGVRLSTNQNIDSIWPRTGTLAQLTGLRTKDLYLSGGAVAPGATPLSKPWVCLSSKDTGPLDIRLSLRRWYRPAGGNVPDRIYYEFNELTGSATHNAAQPAVGALNATVSGHVLGNLAGQFHKGLKCNGGSATGNFVNTGWAPNLGNSAWSIGMWLQTQPGVPTLNIGGTLLGAVGLPVSMNLVPASVAGTPPRVTLTAAGIVCTVQLPDPFLLDGAAVMFTCDTQRVVRGYRNGVLVSTTTVPGHVLSATNTLRIGSSGAGGSFAAFGVVMDEFRLYAREVPATEVSSTFSSALGSPSSQPQFQVGGGSITFSLDNTSGTALQPVDLWRPVGAQVQMTLFSQTSTAPGDVMMTVNADTLRPHEALTIQSPIPTALLNLDITAPTFTSFFGLGFTTPLPLIPPGTVLVLSGPLELAMEAIAIAPTAPGGVVMSQPVSIHASTQGSHLVVPGPNQDDSSTFIQLGAAPLCGPQSVPFYGTARTSFYVNANGNITFGGASNDFTPTVAEFTSGMPRIAALWSDMGPQVGGNISITSYDGAIIVKWDEVPGTNWQFTNPRFSPTTVAVEFLPSNGGFEISQYVPPAVWRASTDSSLVGISAGAASGTNSTPVVWSNFFGQSLQTTGTPLMALHQYMTFGAPSGYSTIHFPNSDGSAFRVH